MRQKLSPYIPLFSTYLPIVLALSPILAFILLKITGLGYTNLLTFIFILFTLFLFFRKKQLQTPKYIVYLILFFLYSLLINAIMLKDSISIYTIVMKNHFFPFIIFCILIESITVKKIPEKTIIFLLKAVSIIALLVIIIQVDSPDFLVRPVEILDDNIPNLSNEEIRLPSIYSWIGQMSLGLIFVPCLSLIISDSIRKNSSSLVIWIAIGLVVTFLSRARWNMLNMLVILFMVYMYKKDTAYKTIKYIVMLVIIIFSVALLLNSLHINTQSIIDERILSKSQGGISEGSGGTRLLAFQIFPKMFKESPLFGVGSQITQSLETELGGRSSQLHVGYLSLLYYYGIVGGGLYLFFIFFLTKRLLKNARIHKNMGPLYGWLTFVIANLSLNYLAPYEAGILLCLFFDKYYMWKYQEIKINTSILNTTNAI